MDINIPDLRNDIKIICPELLTINSNILLFTNYRSGSNSLGLILGHLYRIRFFTELLGYPNLIPEAKKFIKVNQFFVTNIMPDFLKEYNTSFLSNIPSFKINLIRQEKVAQITSLYITELICWQSPPPLPPYTVNLDQNTINRTVKHFIYLDNLRKTDNTKYDLTLTFENIKPLFKYSGQEEFTKPENYQEIYDAVSLKYHHEIDSLP